MHRRRRRRRGPAISFSIPDSYLVIDVTYASIGPLIITHYLCKGGGDTAAVVIVGVAIPIAIRRSRRIIIITGKCRRICAARHLVPSALYNWAYTHVINSRYPQCANIIFRRVRKANELVPLALRLCGYTGNSFCPDRPAASADSIRPFRSLVTNAPRGLAGDGSYIPSSTKPIIGSIKSSADTMTNPFGCK